MNKNKDLQAGMTDMVTSIAIQGVQGAFHEIAARKIFGETALEIVPCETFAELFATVEDQKSDYGIVAVENTIAGNLTDNYHLLCEADVEIISEVSIPIQQNLIAMKGQIIDNIKEIQSHLVALKQCTDFLKPLKARGVKVVASTDTALSARLIAEQQLTHVAAIGSALAAEMYGLEILAEGIENHKQNRTRFLLIKKKGATVKDSFCNKQQQKATMCFTLPNSKGQLAEVVSIFSTNALNLTNFILTPIPDRHWEYRFCVDLTFSNKEDVAAAVATIKQKINDFKILGVYEQC